MSGIQLLLIVCPALFLTGLVDAVAGGGGLISLPVFLLTGLPPRTAFGTNKFIAMTGSLTAAFRYFKDGYFDRKPALMLASTIVAGELMGTGLVYLVPEKFFSGFLSVVLPLAAIFTIVSGRSFRYERKGIESGTPREKHILLIIGLVIGLYAGTIGAAGATLGMILLCTFIHYDVRTANGTLKFAMAIGSVFGFAIFVINGNVAWLVAIPAMICNMLGNYVGSGLAVKNGAKIVRPVALAVVLIYTIKTFAGFIS